MQVGLKTQLLLLLLAAVEEAAAEDELEAAFAGDAQQDARGDADLVVFFLLQDHELGWVLSDSSEGEAGLHGGVFDVPA